MKTFPLVLMSALALAACQKNATVRETAGQGFVQLAGSELVLHQPLTVAAGKSRVFIQGGGPAVGVGHGFGVTPSGALAYAVVAAK